MWVHVCRDGALLWVGFGEPCNWCDVPELRCDEVDADSDAAGG